MSGPRESNSLARLPARSLPLPPREMLGRIDDDEERRSVRRQLDYKLLKLNMMRKRPLDLEEFPEYREKIIDRLGG